MKVLNALLMFIFIFSNRVLSSNFEENVDYSHVGGVTSDEGPLIVKYDNFVDFQEKLKLNAHFVMFYNSKCEICEEIDPILGEIAKKLRERQKKEPILVAKVECDTEGEEVCREIGITNYPTLAVFKLDLIPITMFSGEFLSSHMEKFVDEEASKLTEKTVEKEVERHGNIIVLNDFNFKKQVASGRHFVKFFVPWCGHCQQLAPTWADLADSLKHNVFISVAEVDCTTNTETCGSNKIVSYPTLVYFKDGRKKEIYDGPRDHSSLKMFISSMEPHHSIMKIIEVTSETFNKTISSGASIVRFYDDECPNCQDTESGWHDLVDDVLTREEEEIKMAKINCKKNQNKCFEQNVFSIPAIVFYKNGIRVDIFRGSHYSSSDLMGFVDLLKDKEVYEMPIPDLSYVVQLKTGSFDVAATSENFLFVKFFVPWCEFCKALAPTWEHLAGKLYGKNYISVAEINCSEQNMLCHKNQIRGYPTMLLFHDGEMIDMYTGSHDLDSLHNYIMMMVKQNHHLDEL